jgi:hypothetical protein
MAAKGVNSLQAATHLPPACCAVSRAALEDAIRSVKYTFPAAFLKFKTVRTLYVGS